MVSAIGGLPRVPLDAWPTPLQALPRLTAHLGGPHLWAKRDDTTSLALGGNKVRKLEYLLGHALQVGATAVITTGAHTSNHARLTAAACRQVGLRPYLVLRSPEGTPDVQGNLLLDHLLGAQIRFVPDGSTEAVAAEINRLAAELTAAGEVPYTIPTGGSVGRGAIGYIHAMEEITTQAAAFGFRPDAVLTASGSGGTQAGLLLGSKVSVVGVLVGDDDPAAASRQIIAIASEARDLARLDAPPLEPPELLTGYAGPGYGQPGPDTVRAIGLVARTEGLLLDPVYTGKAMAGLIAEVRRGRWRSDQHVVFLHTGGQSALFSFARQLSTASQST